MKHLNKVQRKNIYQSAKKRPVTRGWSEPKYLLICLKAKFVKRHFGVNASGNVYGKSMEAHKNESVFHFVGNRNPFSGFASNIKSSRFGKTIRHLYTIVKCENLILSSIFCGNTRTFLSLFMLLYVQNLDPFKNIRFKHFYEKNFHWLILDAFK